MGGRDQRLAVGYVALIDCTGAPSKPLQGLLERPPHDDATLLGRRAAQLHTPRGRPRPQARTRTGNSQATITNLSSITS